MICSFDYPVGETAFYDWYITTHWLFEELCSQAYLPHQRASFWDDSNLANEFQALFFIVDSLQYLGNLALVIAVAIPNHFPGQIITTSLFSLTGNHSWDSGNHPKTASIILIQVSEI